MTSGVPSLSAFELGVGSELPCGSLKSHRTVTLGRRLRNWISEWRHRYSRRRSRSGCVAGAVQSLEIRQVLTGDELEFAISRFQQRHQDALDQSQQEMVSLFEATSAPTLSSFIAEVGTLTQFGLAAQPPGPPVQIMPSIVTDLTQVMSTAQTDIGNTDNQIVGQITSEANRMKDEHVYDRGLSVNFDFENPVWIYYYSDTMIFDYNVMTGDYCIQITDTYEDSTPEDGFDTDVMQVNGILTNFSGEESFEVTTSRNRTTDDNSRTNSWTMTYSQVGDADPTFDLNRSYDSGTHKFTGHIVMANDAIDTAETSAVLKLGPVDARVGYRKIPGEEVFDGGVIYLLGNKLAFDAAYKQAVGIGTLARGGLAYSYDENNWMKSYVGVADMDDPATGDFYVAGGEFQFRLLDAEEKYLSGQMPMANNNPFWVHLLPRRSVLFLNLKAEMEAGQQSVHEQIGGFVNGELSW